MRVAILGAGGPAGANVSRSLRQAGHEVVGIEGNPLHLPMVDADVVLQHPELPWGSELVGWIEGACREHGVDYLHPQPDPMVELVARYKERFRSATLLPSLQTVLLCQDKFACGIQWRRTGLRETRILRIEDEAALREAGVELGYPFWMRAAYGAGARGSSEIHNVEQGEHWLGYWLSRGVDWDFVAEEFLPGRDYAWTSLWYEGDLVTSQARERLEYIYPYLAPSGRTGTPTVAVTVHSEAVNTMATEAVLAIDTYPHGLYCVDLREDAAGTPRPTEINVGRFFTTSYFYTAAGVNIPDLAARLALDGRGWWLKRPDMNEPPKYNAVKEGLYWVRHIDCGSVLARMKDGKLVPV